MSELPRDLRTPPEDELVRLFAELVALDAQASDERLAEIAQVHPAMAARLRALVRADMRDSLVGVVPGQDAIAFVRSRSGIAVDGGMLTDRTISGFLIKELVGQGGSGAVYRAQQLRPARAVAFKALRPELAGAKARRRFELEAEHLAGLTHPNIARVVAAGFDADLRIPWMVMEFVPNARDIVRYAQRQQLDLRARVKLMATACAAVADAHAHGLLHRDLKPSNILVGDDGVVKVIDFGLARANAPQAGVSVATEPGEIVGTLLYMSPEQCTGDPRALDVRADIFALGAVLYELVTDQAPRQFSDLTVHGAILAVSAREIPRASAHMPSISRDLDAVIAMAAAQDIASRYANVAAFGEDLQRYLNDEPVHARPPRRLRKFRAWMRREPLLASTMAFAFVVTIGFAVGAAFYAQTLSHEAARAAAITRGVSETLVPATKKLGMTQDAPAVRKIQHAAYDLSVLVNGLDHEVTASLALKQAFDWLKGTGRDPVEAHKWASIAERSATNAEGPRAGTALEARCVQVWALLAEETPESTKRGHAQLMVLAPIIEQRDDVDTASDCLATLGELAQAEGNLELALDYYARAAARSTRIEGADSALTVQARHYLVDMHRARSQWSEALALLDELLIIQRRNDRAHSPWTLRFALQRGEALLRLDRAAEAQAQLIETEALVRDWLGPKHAMRNKVRVFLRESITAQGRSEAELAPWLDVEVE